MGERRDRRRVSNTSRGRMQSLRARITHQRAHQSLNDVTPLEDHPNRRDFYELLSERYFQRRLGAEYLIAP